MRPSAVTSSGTPASAPSSAKLTDPWPEVWAEEAGHSEIDPSTEKSRQLGQKGDESKTDGDPGLELDEGHPREMSPVDGVIDVNGYFP